MNNDLISIIVPIYKVEKYINQCLDSICGQTYKNLEIILVDDGSPDNCGKICDEYAQKDSRIKVIHKENGGLSSARNAGLDVIKGEYISFIDSDDFIENNFIEKLYNLCIDNDVDIAECNYLQFENEIEKTKNKDKVEIFTSYEMQNRMYSVYGTRTTVVWNKLYKNYIYKELRFPNGKINEDEFCTYKAFYNCKKKIAVTNENLYYYRYNSESIMGKKFNSKRFDVIDAYEERKTFYKKHNEIELYKKTLKSYINTLRYYYELTSRDIEKPKKYLVMLHNISKENYKELKKLKGKVFKLNVKDLFFIFQPNIYVWLKNIKFLKKIAGG